MKGTALPGIIENAPVTVAVKEEGEDLYQTAMRPVVHNYDQLKAAYENLQDLVNVVVDRTQLALNGRYKGRLEQEKRNVQKMKEKLKQIEEQMEHDPLIYQLQDEIDAFQLQVTTLSRTFQNLQQSKIETQNLIQELQSKHLELNMTLKSLNRDNLRLTYVLEEVGKKTRRVPLQQQKCYTEQPSVQKSMRESQLESELDRLKQELKTLRSTNQQIKKAQANFVVQNRTLEEFFCSCWSAAEKELIKAQRMITDKQGLSGSLYFEIIRKHNMIEDHNKKQDRHPKDLIYDTFKKMALSAREEHKNRELVSLDVTWEEFSTFSALQILGLLSLRADVVASFHQAMFPNNLLNKQSMPVAISPEPFSMAKNNEELQVYLRKKEEKIFARMQEQFQSKEKSLHVQFYQQVKLLIFSFLNSSNSSQAAL